MAPFTAWLPPRIDYPIDLVLAIAGEGIAAYSRALQAFERTLADHGFEIIAQHGRLKERNTSDAVRIRISTKPLTSMGHGCDMLVWLDKDLPDLGQFGVQIGSVLLCEPQVAARLNVAVRTGLITYLVPFHELARDCGECLSGKGLVALGVLSRLLGLPPEVLCHHLEIEYSRRYFNAGVTFVATHLKKRDVYALSTTVSYPGRVLLNVQEAIAVGLSNGFCKCPTACLSTLEESPGAWVSRHVSEGAGVIASAEAVGSIEAYVGPCNGMTVMVGRENPCECAPIESASSPIVLVASDIADILSLLVIARRIIRETKRLVRVIVDGPLTRRVQTVSINELRRILEAHDAWQSNEPNRCGANVLDAQAEREGALDADVGYVAWGSAQGVVREAVAMCHGFGLDVAALYPKSLPPLCSGPLEAFGRTVANLVVVECTESSDYAGLVTSATSLRPLQLRPEPGEALTAMDIFLREGLGCRQHD